METGRAKMLSIAGPPASFGIGDVVRFVGTDKPYVIREYNPKTLECRVQSGDESQWALQIYFEQIPV
jgi:hypothetical protein